MRRSYRRSRVGVAVIAFALAGSVGTAAAQYDPPPTPPAPVYQAYPPPPPPAYLPQPYSNTPPPAQSHFAPQPLTFAGGPPALLPPADVGDGDSADVTGAISSPRSGRSDSQAGPQADAAAYAAFPPDYRPEQGPPQQLPPRFQRQLVDYPTPEPAGTIIVDTTHTHLYLVMGHGKALRYGIGVGRQGFTWSGTERISRMKEWPDWYPPREMIGRQPYLPRFMAGGETNPLGARALYLGNTLYRIHGTNQPSTIGTFVSSGCIRLTNADIKDLYDRVEVGTRVVVLPGSPQPETASVQNANR